MKLADGDGDDRVTLPEYEKSIIRALKKQGVRIYENEMFWMLLLLALTLNLNRVVPENIHVCHPLSYPLKLTFHQIQLSLFYCMIPLCNKGLFGWSLNINNGSNIWVVYNTWISKMFSSNSNGQSSQGFKKYSQ